ncbi:MAG: hypothetical protein K6B70_05860 [Clostridia bacterium]|nr:hypothetical protein [Clostridia bacterium]
MKKLISNFVEVEGNFVKGTNIVTGFKTIEFVKKKQHLSKRKIIGKIVKEDKFCNSKYKYKVRLFPGVYRWYKASEIKDMKNVK